MDASNQKGFGAFVEDYPQKQKKAGYRYEV